jgi:hypothetical protein
MKLRQSSPEQTVNRYIQRSTDIGVCMHSICNEKELHSSRRNVLLYLFIKTAIKLTVLIMEECHCYQLLADFYPTFFCQG